MSWVLGHLIFFSRGTLDTDIYLAENPSTPSLMAGWLNHLLRTDSSMPVSVVFSVVSPVAALPNHLLHIKDSTHHSEGRVPASRCRKFETRGNYPMLTVPAPTLKSTKISRGFRFLLGIHCVFEPRGAGAIANWEPQQTRGLIGRWRPDRLRWDRGNLRQRQGQGFFATS